MAKSSAKQGHVARCFLITPIGSLGSEERDRADWIFEAVVRAVDSMGVEVQRADTMAGSPMITSRIFGAINEAELCVADLTGLNANVFYELGVRHALKKPVAHIALEGTGLPFDNQQHDTLFYNLRNPAALAALTASLRSTFTAMLEPDYQVSNPFSAALGAIQASASGDSKDMLVGELMERVAALERRRPAPRYMTDRRFLAEESLMARAPVPPANSLNPHQPPVFTDEVIRTVIDGWANYSDSERKALRDLATSSGEYGTLAMAFASEGRTDF